jgi:hypothetical protein
MGYGGHQEARGNDGTAFYNGDKYYVSHVLEELDAPGEFSHPPAECSHVHAPLCSIRHQ